MKKNESLTNKTVNGFIWTGMGTVSKALLQILVVAVLARLIDVKSFGIVNAALVVVGFAKIISQMGIGPALVQKKKLTERHIRVGYTMSLALGIFLSGTLFLMSEWIAGFFKIEELGTVMKIICLLFLSESFVTVSSSLLQRDMRLKEIALVDLISYLIGYGAIGITLGYLHYDYWALIIAIFAQEIIKIAIYFRLQSHSLIPLWSKKEFDDLIHYGGGHTLAVIGNYFTKNGDNFIVAKYLGAQTLGYYGQAFSLMLRPYNLFAGALDQALFPALSVVQDDKEKLRINFEKIIKVLSMLVLPLILFFIIMGDEIVILFLGQKWLPSSAPLKILSLTIFFRITTRVSDILVKATGDVYSRAWRRGISAVVLLTSCLFGLKWGMIGVAWAVVFTNLVTFFLMASLTFKHIRIKWFAYLGLYFRGIVLSTIFGVVLITFKILITKLTSTNFVILCGASLIAVVVSLGITLYFKNFFIQEVKEYVVMFLKKLKLKSLIKFID